MTNGYLQRVLGMCLACVLTACGGGGNGGSDPTSGTTVRGVVSLARTGQVTSYAAGDDGAIQSGVAWPNPRFVVDECGTPGNTSDDVVTDSLAGLMWVRNHGGATTRTWQQSLDYANGLSLCGFDDWRLANVNELEGLVNVGDFAWLGGQGFVMSQSGFWSSSTVPGHPYRAWLVDTFANIGAYDKTNTTAAWAVRGAVVTGTVTLARTGQTTCFDAAGTSIPCSGTGQDGELQAGTAWPSTRFNLNECGTPADTSDDVITDSLTGLSWSRDADRYGTRTWAEALGDAAGLTLCGYSDWRLPNRRELHSLVDHEQYVIATWLAAQGFEDVQGINSVPCYWTSTSPSISSTDYAFCGSLFEGEFRGPELKTAPHHVWPVRGGV